ncbi:hypothetical protein [Pseudoalteromonas umbrosa]|uniref:hypothetical protein n=1 Tax=Pseudoalteromonas umbrosa TaxID=3048489 RepID=UPI0024C38173|nr:hypothetical protein [Pseudoalteromonas sp. B95]MDK1290126.1 hypothetical protein [Pseudoalteromonas sp. B95]
MKLSEIFERYSIDTFRASLEVDKHRLDDMLMQQPMLQQRISEMAAEVASMRDSAKERLARVDAQVAKRLRKQLLIEEGKSSEARIDREVPLTQEHKEAFYIYNELCTLTAQWEALKDSFRNRAFIIRDLVSLYTANFFTDTSFRSESNPQAVQSFEYNQVRSVIAQGRRARNQLSGIENEVELLADVDDKEASNKKIGKHLDTPSAQTDEIQTHSDDKALSPRERARRRQARNRRGSRVTDSLFEEQA